MILWHCLTLQQQMTCTLIESFLLGVEALVRWATGTRLTNRPPKLSVITATKPYTMIRVELPINDAHVVDLVIVVVRFKRKNA